LLHIEPFGSMLITLGKLMPYIIVILVFSFLYMIFPNTRVKFAPALLGGTVAGILWETSGWGFAVFVAGSSKYAAIYSGFAILVLLLIWLYLSWLILLTGSQIAFYAQYPQYLSRYPIRFELSNRLRERLALTIMALVAERHVHRLEPWTPEMLAEHLGIPVQPVHKVLRLLLDAGFLATTADESPQLLPRHDIDSIGIAEVLQAVRSAGENSVLSPAKIPSIESVTAILECVNEAGDQALQGKTIRDLV
jgi:membrane protein